MAVVQTGYYRVARGVDDLRIGGARVDLVDVSDGHDLAVSNEHRPRIHHAPVAFERQHHAVSEVDRAARRDLYRSSLTNVVPSAAGAARRRVRLPREIAMSTAIVNR